LISISFILLVFFGWGESRQNNTSFRLHITTIKAACKTSSSIVISLKSIIKLDQFLKLTFALRYFL
jgi:hypothetical protein